MNECTVPHAFRGSSDQSLQSLCESHTLTSSMHSPLLHWNLVELLHVASVASGKGGKAVEVRLGTKKWRLDIKIEKDVI